MRFRSFDIGRLLLAGLLVGSLLGCSSFSAEEPALPDSTLVDVLTELHLAQVRVDLYKDTSFTALRDSILAHHGVSEARLERALHYYSERPDEYVPIYGAVQDSLEAGRQRLLE